ncbi:MAG: polysulfide reductase NrfD [Actinobacteria bacterium]|nr:polysulfide reductase NrfD [Actinomycetota bacterium]
MSGSQDRHVDPERALLSGEGAGQRTGEGNERFPVRSHRTEHGSPDDAAAGDGGTTYYDQPLLKEPIWIWSVPAYFYVGGVTSGAAIVGAVAQLADRRGLDRLIRRSRWLAGGGAAVSTLLLIIDLGRPARFLNMLRVFRPSSAMSVGSWALAATASAAGASAVLPAVGARRLGDAAGLGAGALAPVLGTYTAVLLSDTAVPLWQATRTSLPRFFAASATVATASALELFPALDAREEAIARRLGMAAKVADLVCGEQVQHQADEVARVGRPLHEGASGALWRTAKLSTATSLAVSLVPVPARWRVARRILSAVLGSIGSLAGRFAVFHAGKRSTRDPRATFVQQRAGRGAAAMDGLAGVTGPAGRRATDA